MDLMQKVIYLSNENSKFKSAKEYNLGTFIKDLEKLDGDKEIIIEDGVYPSCFCSWRGSYCELSLDFDRTPILVRELLEKAKDANGKTFIGYKGGEFLMDFFVPIHIAAYGNCDYCGEFAKLIGIKEYGDKYILVTRDDRKE